MSENLKLQPIQNWLKKNNWFFYDHQLETLNQSINAVSYTHLTLPTKA